jgi:hypothetical protein
MRPDNFRRTLLPTELKRLMIARKTSIYITLNNCGAKESRVRRERRADYFAIRHSSQTPGMNRPDCAEKVPKSQVTQARAALASTASTRIESRCRSWTTSQYYRLICSLRFRSFTLVQSRKQREAVKNGLRLLSLSLWSLVRSARKLHV